MAQFDEEEGRKMAVFSKIGGFSTFREAAPPVLNGSR
jgi:hypothetical protein